MTCSQFQSALRSGLAALALALFPGLAGAADVRVLLGVDPADATSDVLLSASLAPSQSLSRAIGSRTTITQTSTMAEVMRASRTVENEIIVGPAQQQLRARTDSGQAFGNGLSTNLWSPEPRREPQAPPEGRAGVDPSVGTATDPGASDIETLDTRIKQERLEALERANRKAAEDEAAAQGRYVSAAATKRQMTMLVAQTMRIFEGAIPEIASAIAAELKFEERDVIPLLNREFRRVREQASQTHKRLAEGSPRLVEDQADAPEA